MHRFAQRHPLAPVLLALLVLLVACPWLPGCAGPVEPPPSPTPLLQAEMAHISEVHADYLGRIVERRDRPAISCVNDLVNLSRVLAAENHRLREELRKQDALLAESNRLLGLEQAGRVERLEGK